MSRLYERGAGTWPVRTFSSTAKSESPVKSFSPQSSSQSSTPTAKTSLRWSIGWPRTCSGDMYANLPLRMPAWVCCSRLSALAMPKSISLTSPSNDTITFCGETSRCTM